MIIVSTDKTYPKLKIMKTHHQLSFDQSFHQPARHYLVLLAVIYIACINTEKLEDMMLIDMNPIK
jgi:hypothetical protein